MCSVSTVRNIRRKYLDEGLDAAITDKGWPDAPPKFTGEIEAQLIMLACSTPPEGYAKWTLRLLADEMIKLEYVETISHVKVGELLKKRSQAVASEILVYRQAVATVRRQDGRRAGSLPASL